MKKTYTSQTLLAIIGAFVAILTAIVSYFNIKIDKLEDKHDLTKAYIEKLPNISSFEKYIINTKIDTISTIQPNDFTFRNFGICTPLSTNLSNEYIKVEVHLKGSRISLDNFDFDNVDYASHPGCFNSRGGDIAMVNYIKRDPSVKTIPFSFKVRSQGVVDNTFQFSMKVYSKDGRTLLSKFPLTTETLEGQIHFLQYPVLISDTLKFN